MDAPRWFNACADGNLNQVKALLSSGVDIEQTYQSYTALSVASQTGQYSVVDYLISQGANVEAKNNAGGSPLHVCCHNGHHNVAELLISKGADLESRTTVNGRTPLHVASIDGHFDVMSLLISHGADVELVMNYGGYTPISVAVIGNQPRAVDLLIAKGCNFNTPTSRPPSTQLVTPLQLAEARGFTEIVEILKAPNKKKKKKEYNRRKKVEDKEAKRAKEVKEAMEAKEARKAAKVKEEEVATAEEDDKKDEDDRKLGIEEQIEGITLLPPPSPVQVNDIATTFAEADDNTLDSSNVTAAI